MIVPSRRELADTYNVSLGTIERAMAELLADGTLTARDRRGTFVSHRNGSLESAPTQSEAPPRTATIGVVCPLIERVDEAEWEISWDYAIVSAVERSIAALGMRSRFAPIVGANRTQTPVEPVVESLLADGVDGLLFVLVNGPQVDPLAIRFGTGDPALPPAVFIIGAERLIPGTCVYYDNKDAGYRAARHLIHQGCERLQFLAPYAADFAERRLQGVSRAAALAGLPPERLERWIDPRPIDSFTNAEHTGKGLRWLDHKIAGYEWARQTLSSGLRPEGVVAANDEVAAGFLAAASEGGLTAGRDYAIVGFDDMPVARTHGVTTMRPPLEAMAEKAVRLVVEAVDGRTIGEAVSLHSQLIVRQSSHRQNS